MTTLDYAHVFETDVRLRQRQRALLRALCAAVFGCCTLASVALLVL